MSNNEQIKLTLPINAAYVSAARLTASSVANRLNFDIEEIEDIKVAVSEACAYIINKFSFNTQNDFKIIFDLSKDCIKISLSIKGNNDIEVDKEEMSILVIKALADSFQVECSGGIFKMVIIKNHTQTSFGK